MKAIVYLQSGGPTPVINTSLYGVIKEARERNMPLFGSHNGVEGLINDDLFDLSKEDEAEIEKLRFTPGAILGSSRKKLSDGDEETFSKIKETLKRHDIGYILLNGGNDSMDTTNRLSKYSKESNLDIKVIGIPKTVDNDLCITDHSIGYPSACRHIMDALAFAKEDAKVYKKGKVIIFEIMGRDAGWLTASAYLLPKENRPDLIYVPEMPFDEERFLKEVEDAYEEKKYCIIAMSEGVPLDKVNFAGVDSFGHSNLEGVSQTAAALINHKLGLPTRVIADTSLQRSDAFSITGVDSFEAEMVGREAVKAILSGESGKMVALERISNNPYESQAILVDANKIANLEKRIPANWLISSKEISNEFLDYLSPLIKERIGIKLEDGKLPLSHFRYIKAN